jgi:hypothetical protein
MVFGTVTGAEPREQAQGIDEFGNACVDGPVHLAKV